ncbi:DUF551 domain-containing protein [Klebsiella pneumoniae]|uniref:DUF551 domain-containing protein n=1 Tax=Klebsiella pneumoniae TaxID=573 RepID=UPI001D18E75F|nr:DUF551 domain-containing protein [Klebsiella pneumoniae]MCM6738698.1 DUF551 domain-containing protein [Klebsiella pneumoniae]WBL94100.1 DUF551 domain-containing protein [Klebsiella pneumoniae subsp. pneumoniae]
MTKSTITRERLQEIAEDGFLKHGESKELARMALAAMDSEPVAYISKSDFDAGYPHILARRDFNKACTMAVYAAQPAQVVEREPIAWLNDAYLARGVVDGEAGSEDAGPGYIPVYRHAQPALVVPDEIKHRIGGLDWGWEGEFNRGWNACRAAMLAAAPQSPGGDHATVPGKWIPVSERLPEDSGRYWCYVEEQNDLGKSHYQWNCSWNGDRWWVESEGGGIVTHWIPLPAAPQEVNRE